MSLGQRIKYFRKRMGMNQHELGVRMGFTENTADVRIAQYEKDHKHPKDNALLKMAHILNISPNALRAPDIESPGRVMHTLFALEDMYGLTVTTINGRNCLIMDPNHPNYSSSLDTRISSWASVKESMATGTILKDEYDEWRYQYPRSKAQIDQYMMEMLRERLKAMEEALENGDDDI